MNGLDVNILSPKEGEIHEGDPIHFGVHLLRDGDHKAIKPNAQNPANPDQDFEKVDQLIITVKGIGQKNIGYELPSGNLKPVIAGNYEKQFSWEIEGLPEGPYLAIATIIPLEEKDNESLKDRIKSKQFFVERIRVPLEDQEVRITGPVKLAEGTEISIKEPIFKGPVNVSLQETRRIESPDQLLWILIRNRTIKFDDYEKFIDSVMSDDNDPRLNNRQLKYLYASRLSFNNVASYSLLKFATEKYLMQECGLVPSGLLNGEFERWKEFIEVINNDKGRTARASLDPQIDIDKLKDEFLDKLLLHGSALPYLDLIRKKLKELKPKELYAVAINFVERDNNGNGVILEDVDTINIDATYGILPNKLISPPMMELIWSYWHEEGGLVQTMNAISRRFQNIRNGFGKDPLTNFNLDPLRPLNNLLWGYIEDERNRLSMSRRNLEYQYEYGISLIGKAVPQIGVAEHRTNFIRAFHNLLKVALDFYNQANFTTVIPDAFPLLNHLREVHLILAEGAHNQYGDLPWTSRAEMLIQQWLLSRTEMREFLGGRLMVPYNEPWMDKVDSMKTLQDWNVPNITHFHDLAVFGEQLLLSVRYGNWSSTTKIEVQNAANWAHYWRNEVQRYVHAYNAVTGVDLSADITDARVQISTVEDRYTPPALLIQKQAALQKSQQQYALQSNGIQPGLLQNRPAITMSPQSISVIGQKKLNG